MRAALGWPVAMPPDAQRRVIDSGLYDATFFPPHGAGPLGT